MKAWIAAHLLEVALILLVVLLFVALLITESRAKGAELQQVVAESNAEQAEAAQRQAVNAAAVAQTALERELAHSKELKKKLDACSHKKQGTRRRWRLPLPRKAELVHWRGSPLESIHLAAERQKLSPSR